MNGLLLHSGFDSFLFIEGEIVTFCTFQFDGHLKKDFFHQDITDEPVQIERNFALWKEVREFCFSLIKREANSAWLQACIIAFFTEYRPSS